jgi:predicted nucleotidyltransferase
MPTADDRFVSLISDQLAGLPTVEAVALGGSRATGAHRPESDWDFAIYYRGSFAPDSLRALGWPGEVSEIGGWGGGVFNGGGWLEVDGRRVDVHYRDLDDVAHHLAEAQEGRFHIERLLFHLAGIPSYIVVAELANNHVLHGSLPRPDYPKQLKQTAHGRWWGEAELTLGYARTAYAERGLLAETVGAVGTATCMAAHAVLAGRGEWVTNEKRLVDRAGLRGIDGILAGREPVTVLDEAAALLRGAVESGGEGPGV